ncbi:hypothetical protein PHISP_01564 [Aspergillus sp. HF37]|nr:hypothetical protein PHISP_01564 [Aspergillus sp. HF37]
MFSYHRILSIFGRSVQDKTLQCDLYAPTPRRQAALILFTSDIHPWEIWVDGQQWSGRIRLIGFIDAFFVISYSADNSFERGIVVYKEKDTIDSILADIQEKGTDEQKEAAEQPENSDFSFEHKGVYTARGWGHPIGLKVEYPVSSLRRIEIKINKPMNVALRRRIKRGITRHSIPELMQDAVHCGFITHGQLMGNFLGQFMGGGVLDDTRQKYMQGLMGGSQAGNVGLSNDST